MKFCQAIARRKQDSGGKNEPSQLIRALGTFDLVALGVGSTLGVGIYVLAGEVAKQVAGPAVIVSFLLAAIVTAFAGLCYAEFGARVPKAGSAYIYSYYCIGEFIAFVIGWSLILEYSIGAASVAKGISSYIDNLIGNTLRSYLTELFPLDHPFLSTYIDVFAMGLCLTLAFALALGVKESSIINNIFTTCNVCVVIFFIIAGSVTADFSNWSIPKENITEAMNAGEGGFAPFGVSGIIHGAAICFYGFVGFDCIATTGEEVRNPQRAIPLSIVLSLVIILTAYLGVSSVLTLMLPYYLQDPDAPIPHAFELIGWHTCKWIISIGALFGLFASLFGALFPLPRIIYAMANDGLLYRWLGQVSPRFHTPLIGTVISGLFTSVLAAFFNLQQLVGLNAIGTLVTYTLVSVCVLILRYGTKTEDDNDNEETQLLPKNTKPTCRQLFKHFLTFHRYSTPNSITSKLVAIETFLFCILSVLLSVAIVFYADIIYEINIFAISIVSILASTMILLMISIAIQPTPNENLFFKMPLVPYIPCLSIFANVYLMIVLDAQTWIRFVLVMLFAKLKMYRAGQDLEGIVDSNYAFLNDMHGGDTLPRNNTWSNRNPVIYTQPRFNSVRDIPEYAVPRTRQRDPFDGGNWVDTRKMNGTHRSLPQPRDAFESGDSVGTLNGTHRSLQQKREPVVSADWADPRNGAHQSLEQQRGPYASSDWVDTRNGAHRSFQQQRGPLESGDWEDTRNLNGTHPSLQQKRSQPLDGGVWVSTPNRTDQGHLNNGWEATQRNEYHDDFSDEDTWEDRQTYDEDHSYYRYSEHEVWEDPRKINRPQQPRGSYLLQRTSDMVRDRPHNLIPFAESSYLLNRTNHYLQAIQRMDNPVEPKSTPPPPPQRTSSTLTSKTESIPAPPPPPPPPPMTLPNPEPKPIAKKPKENKNLGVPVPELEDIQKARQRLRPVPQKLDQQTGMQEFKDELSQKLYQIHQANQRWENVLQPPVLEANQHEILTGMTEEKYKTVKTLPKNALKQKLTGLLQQGPQKPSFRGGQAMEEKRRNVAQQFLSNENKTYTVTEPDDALPKKPTHQNAVISEVSSNTRSSIQPAKR